MNDPLFRAVVDIFAFAVQLNLAADDPPITEVLRVATPDSADYEEQVEHITREYRQKHSELQRAYQAAIQEVHVKEIDGEASHQSPVEPLLAVGPSVAVFAQFRPNAKPGGNHVLHILTSEGRSLLIPYQFHEQMGGTWRSIPSGIEYTWKRREAAASAAINFDPSRPGYSHPNAKTDDLVNAHGHLVVGDATFLQNGKRSETRSNAELSHAQEAGLRFIS